MRLGKADCYIPDLQDNFLKSLPVSVAYSFSTLLHLFAYLWARRFNGLLKERYPAGTASQKQDGFRKCSVR